MKPKPILSRNLAHLRTLSRKSQQEVADALGFKHKSRYGAYEDGRAEPPADTLRKLSDLFEVPIDLLLREDLTNLTWKDYFSLKDNWVRYLPLEEVKRRSRIIVAPRSGHAKAGLPAASFSDEFHEMEVITLPGNPGAGAIAFPIEGNSMPPVADGDFVIARKVASLRDIPNGTACIVRFQEDEGALFETLFKIVYNHTKDDGCLHLHSTNPAYPVRKLPANQVRELYVYYCHISYQAPSGAKVTIEDLGAMLHLVKRDIEKLKRPR